MGPCVFAEGHIDHTFTLALVGDSGVGKVSIYYMYFLWRLPEATLHSSLYSAVCWMISRLGVTGVPVSAS